MEELSKMLVRLAPNETHWFIKLPNGKNEDLTSDQFDTPVPYEKGKPKAFLTKKISKRGGILAEYLGLSGKKVKET